MVFDGAGLAKSEEFDFKGNLLSSARHIATAYATLPTWEALPSLSAAVTPADVESAAVANGFAPASASESTRFATSNEDLTYTYDPIGNIVEIHDTSSAVPIFANPVTERAHGWAEVFASWHARPGLFGTNTFDLA